jgi:hypothetical protein
MVVSKYVCIAIYAEKIHIILVFRLGQSDERRGRGEQESAKFSSSEQVI